MTDGSTTPNGVVDPIRIGGVPDVPRFGANENSL